MFWILATLLSITFLYFYLIKPFRHWAKMGVPQSSVQETAFEILRDTFTPDGIAYVTEKIYKKFEGKRYGGAYQFYKPALVLRDPDLIKQLSIKDFDHFTDHSLFFGEEPIWEKNLFALRGEKWRDMRSTLSPSFTSSKMKTMFGLISDCAIEFVRYFEDQNEDTVVLEMKDCFSRFTNDVIGTTAFGITCNSLRDRDNEFYVMGKKMTSFDGLWNNIKLVVVMSVPSLAKYLGIKIFSDEVVSFFRNLVLTNIRTREEQGIVRPDMIHLLMEAKKGREKNEAHEVDEIDEGFAVFDEGSKANKPKKAQLTNEDIVSQALIFFFAGFDTVSSQLCFLAYELAVNPDIQQRLCDEVDATYEECDGKLTYDALLKMKYLDMVISETLRKWPVAVILDRVCVKPYTVQPERPGESPVHVRVDDVLWLPIFGLHRDPKFYPDPERFDPERFSDENRSKINPYAYAPFGLGPRNCIGNRFALLETKAVLFHLLSKFKIVPVKKTVIPLKLAKSQIQLTAEGGFWLGLERRTG